MDRSRAHASFALAKQPRGRAGPPHLVVVHSDSHPRDADATNAVTKVTDLGMAAQPLGVTFDRTGRKAYVTQWLGRAVSVIDTATETTPRPVMLSPPSNPLKDDHPSAIAANPATRRGLHGQRRLRHGISGEGRPRARSV